MLFYSHSQNESGGHLLKGFKKMSRQKQIGSVIAIIVILGLIGYVAYSNFKPEALPEYNVTEVYKGDIQSTYETKGTVASNNTVTYQAASGVKVTSVNVNVGDSVKAGDVLATFDTAPLSVTLKEYKTAYDKANSAYNDAQSKISTANANIKSTNVQLAQTNNEISQLEKEIAAAESSTTVEESVTQYSPEQIEALIAKLQTGGFTQEEINSIISSLQAGTGNVSSADVENAIENATATKKLQLAQKQSQKQLLETQISLYEAQTDDTALSIYKSVLDNKKADYDNYKNLVDSLKDGWVASADGIITEVNITAGEAFVPAAKTSTTTDLSSIMSAVSGDADITSVLSDIIGSSSGTDAGSGAGIVLENSNEFIAEFSVGKYDLLSLKVGQAVTVTSLGNVYDAEVIYVSATASESSSLDLSSLASSLTGSSGGSSSGALVRIKIKNPDEKIIIGFDVDISVNTEKITDVLIIPIDAVTTEDGTNYVYVADSENVVSKKEVTVGAYSTDEYQLVSGVELGERVVDNPKTSLTEGAEIAVKG